jgi:hypothetical protein
MRQRLGLLYQDFALILSIHILGVPFQEHTAHLRRYILWCLFCVVNVSCCLDLKGSWLT